MHLDKKYNNENIHGNEREVLLSFSGGKDSTVLFHLVVDVYKKIKAENKISEEIYLVPAYAYEITFPETISLIKEVVNKYREDNSFIKELFLSKPKMSWQEILREKGYPIFSKQVSVLMNRIKKVKSKNGLTRWVFGINTSRYMIKRKRLFLLDNNMKQFPSDGIDLEYFGKTFDFNDYFFSEKCCDYIKGGLKHIKKPRFVGTMATESDLRKNSWFNYGCNVFNHKNMEMSRPLSIFKAVDIWKYIIKHNLSINPKYGLNDYTNFQSDVDEATSPKNGISEQQQYDEKIDKSLNSKLIYKRLGCISCPYGSHIEQKNSLSHRFDMLYDQSQLLYKAQVIDTGMYKVLIDMGIRIEKDKKYMQLFEKRHQQIKEWDDNFTNNLAEVIVQIENYKNYKNYNLELKKYSKSVWIYTDEEIFRIFKNYSLELSEKEILLLVNKKRKLIYKNREKI